MQSFAQSGYRIQTYKYPDGLPSDHILSIHKKDGFLYIGTQRGLCLYDGYRFVKHTVFNESVLSIFVKNNQIFLSTNSLGVAQFQNLHGGYEMLAKVNFYDDDTNNDHYDNLFPDSQNRIWCSDQNNLKCLSGKVTQKWKIEDSGSLSQNQLKFFSVGEIEIWAATPKGIFVWNEKLKTLKKHSQRFLANNAFRSGLYVSENKIWLTDLVGNLYSYNAQNGKIVLNHRFSNLPLNIADNQDKNNSRLLVFNKNQIFIYDEKLDKAELVLETKTDINTVFYDEQTKIIWAGTNRGLLKIVSDRDNIQSFKFNRKNNQPIRELAEDHSRNLWMTNGTSEIYEMQPDKRIKTISAQNAEVHFNDIYFNGKLFLAGSDGIYIIENHQIKKVIPLPFSAKKIIKDYQNQLWVLSEKNGIRVFDASNFHEKKNAVLNTENYWKINTSNDIAIGKNGKIWLASWMPKGYGISFFDESLKVFQEINELKSVKNESKFVTDYYNRIVFTKAQNILFSGYGGWNLVSPEGNILRSFFTAKYNVANDHIEGIAEDSRGNIWFGCAEGLYQYNPKTDKAVRVSQLDGLETNDVTFGFYKFGDDRIAIASDSGIQILNLEKIIKTQLINQLKLTSVLKDNVEIPVLSNEFNFDYDFTELDFNFSALTFSDNEKIVYRYRFSDETKWNYLGTNPKLSLIKLPPGNYDIIVEAGDNLGNWQKKQLRINLKINPPFYLTFWFVGLVILAVGFVGYWITRFLLNQEKEKSSLKQKVKDVEMQTLRSQMNPHFLFNSLNSINSFIVQQKSREASVYLTTFSKLMRNILDNSRHETISLEKEIETLKMYMKLEMARLENSFDYQIIIDKNIDAEFVQIPPLILQPFVENAIWHGLVNKNGDGFLKIEIRKDEDSDLIIRISDNGIGRKASALLKKEQVKHKSYGIDITRERLEMLNPKNQIIIIDLEDEHGNATGTLVELKIVYYD